MAGFFSTNPDSNVHVAIMGPTWVLSAPDGPHVGPMNFAIREVIGSHSADYLLIMCPWISSVYGSYTMKPDLKVTFLFVWHQAITLIARFMGPTWGPSGADRTQVGPMLVPWILLSCYLGIWTNDGLSLWWHMLSLIHNELNIYLHISFYLWSTNYAI